MEGWRVTCLCAQWCGVCRDWRAAFEAAARRHPEVAFYWVDVEDETDAMGDLEIETFPTVLVARGAAPWFLGPVVPSGEQLSRLIERLMQGAPAPGLPEEAAALAARLQRKR